MSSTNSKDSVVGSYVYTFACHENERALCELELETMLVPEQILVQDITLMYAPIFAFHQVEVHLSGADWM